MPHMRRLSVASFVLFATAAWITVTITTSRWHLLDESLIFEAVKTPTPTSFPAQKVRNTIDDPVIPLEELVDTEPDKSCPPGLVMINDIRSVDRNITSFLLPRRIPRVIHVTSKSRCVTPNIAESINSWKNYSDHKFFFHNDAAMYRLLFERERPEFPQLRLALACSNTMVEQTDLWRALLLWEYGGIYTDIDTMPYQFNPSTSLQANDEAYFEEEGEGWLSQ